MSVPLIAALVWVVVPAALVAWRLRVARVRDAERWLIDIGEQQLTVRPHGPLDQAEPEDWDALAALAQELGVRDVVLAVEDSDPNAGWAARRAQQRLASVARVTLGP